MEGGRGGGIYLAAAATLPNADGNALDAILKKFGEKLLSTVTSGGSTAQHKQKQTIWLVI